MDLGKKILKLRKEKGWTQQDLAEKLYITDKAVSKWEQGLGLPDIQNLVNLSKLFNVSIDSLLKEDEPAEEEVRMSIAEDKNVFISAHTHAEFLNVLLGKKYKNYMKCTYRFDKDNLIWMIRLNDSITSTGWRNSLICADYIAEVYVGNESDRIEGHKIYPVNQIRYVFDILENEDYFDPKLRFYEFRGIFKLSTESSDNNKRLWKRIDTSATINGQVYHAIDRKETFDQIIERANALCSNNQ